MQHINTNYCDRKGAPCPF